MELIATKRISSALPIGSVFQLPDRQAKMLIAIGVARTHARRVSPAPLLGVSPVTPPVLTASSTEPTGDPPIGDAPVEPAAARGRTRRQSTAVQPS